MSVEWMSAKKAESAPCFMGSWRHRERGLKQMYKNKHPTTNSDKCSAEEERRNLLKWVGSVSL